MKNEKGLLDYLTPDQQKGYVKSLAVLAEPLIKRAYEKGYEKALRDVFDELLGDDVPEGTCCGCNNIGQDAVTHLAKWAAERGIDLEDTP